MDIKSTAQSIHKNAVRKGFWEGENNIGEKLMLVVSELSEAMEHHRAHGIVPITAQYLDTLDSMTEDKDFNYMFVDNVKDTFQDELADAVIRILDLAEGLEFDIEKHIALKMRFNATRERLHGKKY